MRPQRWLLAAVLVLLAPAALAGYGEGSELTAASPAQLQGRVDTLLPNGVAAFLGPQGDVAGLTLRAPDATVTLTTVRPTCAQTGAGVAGTCPVGPATQSEDESLRLTDVRVTLLRAIAPYKLLVTTDRSYADTPSFGDAGRLLLTTAGSTRLDTNAKGEHLSPSDDGWTSDDEPPVVADAIYAAEPLSARYAATGGLLRATGGFETFLQGVVVRVEGTDEKGEAVSRDLETPLPKDEGDAWRFLRIEARQGDLAATSTAALTGYASPGQRPISDVHTRARLEDAAGKLVTDEGERALEREPVELAGPLSLTVVKAAPDGRLTLAIADGLQLAALPPVEEEPARDTNALIAAGAAGAGGAGLLLALAYFWPRLKFAGTLLLLPLYSRIERDSVLEHEKRDELYELIRATPGIHAHEIGEKANIGWGTTVYHLKLLENHGLVVSKKSGRYKRFFVNTGEYTKKKDVYGALRNDTAKAVADFVVNHPGTTQKDMCAALGIQPSLASWHVEKLEGVGLVKRVKDGRQVRYFAGPAWSDLNVRLGPAGADTPAET